MIDFVMEYLYGGLLDLSVTGYVIASLIMLQLAMMAVTLYLHRDAAHRSINLHPVLRHFFRFYIWCTSGMLTRDWVAVHRKHHAYCETENDPHSPQVYGLKKVLLEGAELYKVECKVPETLEKYGRGTPRDWIELNVYERFPWGGITLFVLSCLFFFGVPGIILLAIQLISMPLFAAGIINGVGHHSGYRNFECDDAATNISPIGIFVGGEELHNNHHAFPTSAKFSMRPWEFDIGWMYIKIFEFFGLCKVNKVAPTPQRLKDQDEISLETLRAIVVNRMHVLRDYTREVTLPTLKFEREQGANLVSRAKRLLVRQPSLLNERARQRLDTMLENSATLRTVHEFRERLQTLWKSGAAISNEQLLEQLRQWCAEAEASGIRALQEFADRVRGYAMQPTPVRA
ncbi:MAG: fatty acid desaturase [Pseudomonadota bacterium]